MPLHHAACIDGRTPKPNVERGQVVAGNDD
jgi:hypothetical protein